MDLCKLCSVRSDEYLELVDRFLVSFRAVLGGTVMVASLGFSLQNTDEDLLLFLLKGTGFEMQFPIVATQNNSRKRVERSHDRSSPLLLSILAIGSRFVLVLLHF